MRRVLLLAAVALAVTFSGSVFASQNTSFSQEVSLNMLEDPIDSKIAEQVLTYMAVELNYNLEAITQQYESGTLTITPDGPGDYNVTLLREDGILVSVEIDF